MKAERQHNIEFLRILAMFMILIIHANMISLPRPSYHDLVSTPIQTITRYLIESMGIVGVNVFVMISGWFLIHTRAKSLLSIFFQVVFLWGGLFFVLWGFNKAEFSISSVMHVFFWTRWDWFIKAYIVLMILAPVLNTYIENSTEKQQRYVLSGFFLFSCTYGWIGGANRFFVNGYGPLLFIGLYLLAHYARICSTSECKELPRFIKNVFSFKKSTDLIIFFWCVIINTLIGIGGLYLNKNIYKFVYAYINPVTIIGALYLFLFFSKLDVKNHVVIKHLATGSFAVFLIHSQVDVRPYFTQGVVYLYENFHSVICVLMIFLYLILWYVILVLIDKPRLWVWSIICKRYNLK